jgi:hypothetical protein
MSDSGRGALNTAPGSLAAARGTIVKKVLVAKKALNPFVILSLGLSRGALHLFNLSPWMGKAQALEFNIKAREVKSLASLRKTPLDLRRAPRQLAGIR